jgi:hypothetical protein
MAEGCGARSPDPSIDLRSLEAGTAFLFVLGTLQLRIFAFDWSALSPYGTKPACSSATCPNILVADRSGRQFKSWTSLARPVAMRNSAN